MCLSVSCLLVFFSPGVFLTKVTPGSKGSSPGGREAVGARGDAHTTSTVRNQGTHACWDSAHFPPSARIQPRGRATHSGQVSSPPPPTNQDIQLLGDSRVCRSDINHEAYIFTFYLIYCCCGVCMVCVDTPAMVHRRSSENIVLGLLLFFYLCARSKD